MSESEYGAGWGTFNRKEILLEIVSGVREAANLEEAEEYFQQYVDLAIIEASGSSSEVTYVPVEKPAAPNTVYPDWPLTNRDTVHPQYRVLLDFTTNLRQEIERSVRLGWARDENDFAERVGLHEKSLRRILNGDGWPSVQALVQLEYRLATRLWPVSSRRKTRQRPLWRRYHVEPWEFDIG